MNVFTFCPEAVSLIDIQRDPSTSAMMSFGWETVQRARGFLCDANISKNGRGSYRSD